MTAFKDNCYSKSKFGVLCLFFAVLLAADFVFSENKELPASITDPVTHVCRSMYQVEIKKDVFYLEPGREEKCDLYLPKNLPDDKRVPAIVIIHGGGWKGGDKADKREIHLGTYFAKCGYVAMSINYKLCKNKVPSWPQNIYDCKSAVKFLRKNAARLKVNPDFIGAIGGSAGGHLVSMLAVTGSCQELEPPRLYEEFSSRIQACVDLYGISDHISRGKSYLADILGATLEEDPDLWKLASPIYHVSPDTCPVLILHGLKDTTVDYQQSISFIEALSRESVPSRLILVSGAPHTFPLYYNSYSDMMAAVINFFDERLNHPDVKAE
ncbi:Carboxylesterase NlhH [Limihaloglobus sulfuriphilus]|uniref:Carboxylesterase NlhH n=1 Tax=Limihaloglobus sulfuriphilus TaxID=1851148 RepID=A0A1Q2MB68_9BACT|nr:alpha/beta hydrolase [Limihaloglobus sulfuriphilus]AQQ69909.1 Carboxylesterase NlhH [Limihaloglobus sulfuriphilus]